MPVPGASPKPASHDIKIVACTIACREKLLDEAVRIVHRAGFDGVEIWGREPHTPEKFDENRMRATRKLLDDVGVVARVFGSYLTFGSTRPDAKVELNDTLHVARWLKTPLIRVWASDVASNDASPEVWERTIDEAREASERASKLDMTLVAEMHANTIADTAQAAVQLVESVDHENFRLNFQASAVDDGQTPEDRLRMVLPWVSHVHAQNCESIASQGGPPANRAPLSSGIVDYAGLVRMLKDAGYQGCVAVEFAHDETGDREAALADDFRFLSTICQ